MHEETFVHVLPCIFLLVRLLENLLVLRNLKKRLLRLVPRTNVQ